LKLLFRKSRSPVASFILAIWLFSFLTPLYGVASPAQAAVTCMTGFTATSDDRCVKTFTASGTFTTSAAMGNVQYLLVGGGGGGRKIGTLDTTKGIGGSPGSVVTGTLPLVPADTALTIAVGSGGTGDTFSSANSSTVFYNPLATSGGISSLAGSGFSTVTAAGGDNLGRSAVIAGTTSSISGSLATYGASGYDGDPRQVPTANRGTGGSGAWMFWDSGSCYNSGAWQTYNTTSGWDLTGSFYVVSRYGYGCGGGQGYRFDGWRTVSSSVQGAGTGSAGVVILSYQPLSASVAYSGTGSITNASTLEFDLSFTEAVDEATLTAADFSNTGTATGCVFAITGSGANYSVTVSGCSEGTIVPTLGAGSVNASSGAAGPGSAVSAASITIDRTAPTSVGAPVVTTTPTTVGSSSNALGAFTTAVTLTSSIVAGQATGGRAEFLLEGAVFAIDNTIASDDTSVTMSLSTNATIRAAIAQAGPITVVLYDAAGNFVTSAATTPVVDYVPPTVASFVPASGQAAILNSSSAISFTLVLSESVSGLASGDFSNAGTATGCTFAPDASSGVSFTVTATGCSAGTIQPRLTVNSVMDSANLGPAIASTAASSATRVTTAPTNSVAPALSAMSGSLTELGSTLQSSAGTWNNQGDTSAVITYQWQVCDSASALTCVNITNATNSSFTPDASYLGKYLRTLVTDTNIQGATTVPSSSFAGPLTKAAQSITFAQPTSPSTYSTNQIVLGATASSGLAVTYTTSTTSVCSVDSSGSVTLLAAGTCTISAAQAGDEIYLAASSVQRSITVNPATQSISLTPTSTTLLVGGAPLSLGTTGSLGSGSVTFTVTSGLGTICSISSGVLTAIAAGNCVVTATIAADDRYSTANSVSVTHLVRLPQVISFGQPADFAFDGSGTQTITLNAASDASGLTPVITVSTPGVCSVNNLTLTILTLGTCGLTASEAGNATYAAALPVSVSFISQSTPTAASIDSVDVTPSQNGNSASAVINFTHGATNGATNPRYSVIVTPDDGSTPFSVNCATSPCVVPGLVPGNGYTFAVQTDATVGGQSQSVTSTAVDVHANAITITNPGAKVLPTAPFALSGQSQVNPAWPTDIASLTPSVCTVSNGVVTVISAGTCTLTASNPGGTLNGQQYAANIQALSFAVTNRIQRPATNRIPDPAPYVIVSPLPDASADNGPFALTGVTNTGLDITFISLTPAVCGVEKQMVTVLSPGTCTIQGAAGVWVSVPQSFVIRPGKANIFISTPSDRPLVLNGKLRLEVSGYAGNAKVTYKVISGAPACSIQNGFLTARAQANCVVVAIVDEGSGKVFTSAPVTFKVRPAVEPLQIVKARTGNSTSGQAGLFGANSGAVVAFRGDSAVLTAEGKAKLTRFATVAAKKCSTVYVSGFVMHTGPGTKSDIKLSEARALSVTRFLASLGVNCKIQYFGFGAVSKKSPSVKDRKVVVRWDGLD
jgi:outer membrane protein OmpA-like peptidoglycan-associated protein